MKAAVWTPCSRKIIGSTPLRTSTGNLQSSNMQIVQSVMVACVLNGCVAQWEVCPEWGMYWKNVKAIWGQHQFWYSCSVSECHIDSKSFINAESFQPVQGNVSKVGGKKKERTCIPTRSTLEMFQKTKHGFCINLSMAGTERSSPVKNHYFTPSGPVLN